MIHWRMQVLQQMTRYNLTPTEQRIALQLLRARSNPEVAAVLGITERTVKSHLSEMMRKTQTHNRVGLVLAILAVDVGDDDNLLAS